MGVVLGGAGPRIESRGAVSQEDQSSLGLYLHVRVGLILLSAFQRKCLCFQVGSEQRKLDAGDQGERRGSRGWAGVRLLLFWPWSISAALPRGRQKIHLWAYQLSRQGGEPECLLFVFF